ncbi:MAG: hypothetical protein ACKPKO_32270, partial [Candidatus Fonsibacter sp.]
GSLRGNSQTNSRGLVDVIILTKEALGHLCHNLSILKDHATYKASTQVEALSLRNALDPAQGRCVAFAEDLLHGKRYNQRLKALCRTGKNITTIDASRV